MSQNQYIYFYYKLIVAIQHPNQVYDKQRKNHSQWWVCVLRREDPDYSTDASAEVTSAVVKLLEKYQNTRFLQQIILFFSSADRKNWNVFGQGM